MGLKRGLLHQQKLKKTFFVYGKVFLVSIKKLVNPWKGEGVSLEFQKSTKSPASLEEELFIEALLII